MPRIQNPDAKPRFPEERPSTAKAPYWARRRAARRAVLAQTQMDGQIVMKDKPGYASNPYRSSGVVIGATGPQAGISVDPAVSVMHYFRRKLRPINVPPCIVSDAAGNPIARIITDPVTGKRTRETLVPPATS